MYSPTEIFFRANRADEHRSKAERCLRHAIAIEIAARFAYDRIILARLCRRIRQKRAGSRWRLACKKQHDKWNGHDLGVGTHVKWPSGSVLTKTQDACMGEEEEKINAGLQLGCRGGNWCGAMETRNALIGAGYHQSGNRGCCLPFVDGPHR